MNRWEHVVNGFDTFGVGAERKFPKFEVFLSKMIKNRMETGKPLRIIKCLAFRIVELGDQT